MKFTSTWNKERNLIELAWLPKENEHKDALIVHVDADKGITKVLTQVSELTRGELHHLCILLENAYLIIESDAEADLHPPRTQI